LLHRNLDIVTCISIARQRAAKHIPATTNTSTARQRRGTHAFATIEEAQFSMWSSPRILTRVFCRSGPRLQKGASLKEQQRQENGNTTAYNGVQ
jgi:hypothetical protein